MEQTGSVEECSTWVRESSDRILSLGAVRCELEEDTFPRVPTGTLYIEIEGILDDFS